MPRIQPEDFWQWAYSDFLSNSLRGVLAEYIVARATNCTEAPRIEWDAYDLKHPGGLKIEVKSSAFLQSWPQAKPSKIEFDIAKKKSWFSESNHTSKTAERPADVYVFSVFQESRREFADPLNLDQWFFLVASSDFINKHFGNQKTVSLGPLEARGLLRISHNQLAQTIAQIGPNP